MPDEETACDRIDYIRGAAGRRFNNPELNVIVFDFAVGREPDLTALRQFSPDRDDTSLRNSLNVLHGSVDGIAERITQLHENLGISYFSIIEPDDTQLSHLQQVIARLR